MINTTISHLLTKMWIKHRGSDLVKHVLEKTKISSPKHQDLISNCIKVMGYLLALDELSLDSVHRLKLIPILRSFIQRLCGWNISPQEEYDPNIQNMVGTLRCEKVYTEIINLLAALTDKTETEELTFTKL